MKVIIPLAGKGTRLRPHTHTVPKPMLRVAGKPVIGYLLDDLERLGGVSEIVYITGHLKEAVERWVRADGRFRSSFVEQVVQDGTASAVGLAKGFVDEPVLIIFVDTIFDADLSIIGRTDADGIIWTKEVEDYQRFGVVVTDAQGFMTRIIEKPSTPVSKRANIGLYYIRNWKLLYEGIAETMARPSHGGEYYLTDAFQYMIDHGAKLKVVDVAGWYDAGKLETLLDTNRVMLEKGRARRPATAPAGSRIIDPVYLEDGVELRQATVGPNVSVSAGTVIEGSTVRDAIIGAGATVSGCALHDSMIGDAAVVRGVRGAVSVGDHAEVRGE
ncbi:MAG TPA: sugar phosphate nucleotidyltransferase [Gemmatimonadaceae bacterium]|nr:sugar phosphate nucleotidyltransferase [Gemmatimonadaceae bacterium]